MSDTAPARVSVLERAAAFSIKGFFKTPLYPIVHSLSKTQRTQQRELQHVLTPVLQDEALVREGLRVFKRALTLGTQPLVLETLDDVQAGRLDFNGAADALVDRVFTQARLTAYLQSAFIVSSVTPIPEETLAEVEEAFLGHFGF